MGRMSAGDPPARATSSGLDGDACVAAIRLSAGAPLRGCARRFVAFAAAARRRRAAGARGALDPGLLGAVGPLIYAAMRRPLTPGADAAVRAIEPHAALPAALRDAGGAALYVWLRHELWVGHDAVEPAERLAGLLDAVAAALNAAPPRPAAAAAFARIWAHPQFARVRATRFGGEAFASLRGRVRAGELDQAEAEAARYAEMLDGVGRDPPPELQELRARLLAHPGRRDVRTPGTPRDVLELGVIQDCVDAGAFTTAAHQAARLLQSLGPEPPGQAPAAVTDAFARIHAHPNTPRLRATAYGGRLYAALTERLGRGDFPRAALLAQAAEDLLPNVGSPPPAPLRVMRERLLHHPRLGKDHGDGSWAMSQLDEVAECIDAGAFAAAARAAERGLCNLDQCGDGASA